MFRFRAFGIFGFIVCAISLTYASLKINQIRGPDSVEIGSTGELILDCDFDVKGEEEVVLKWFFNGLDEQIYQWIVPNELAYSLGSLKEFIDPTYRVSGEPNAKLRALKFKEINSALTGNYTCKVSTADEEQYLTKQLIVYAPPSSFEIFLVGGEDEFQGDEVILCDASNVSPRPNFDLFISELNGSLPEMFTPVKKINADDDGVYNVSITLPFNSSYLEDGTTKFVCQLSIPGTNYSETKSFEYFVDSATESLSPFDLLGEEYATFNCTYNSTEEASPTDNTRENGQNHQYSSLLLTTLLVFSLVFAT